MVNVDKHDALLGAVADSADADIKSRKFTGLDEQVNTARVDSIREAEPLRSVQFLRAFYASLCIRIPEASFERIVRMHQEFFVNQSTGDGPNGQPPFNFTTFPNDERMTDLVMVPAISFYSMCEHHMVPFFGEAHIGYLPHERIVGLSKLARLVDWYARRPQLQERLTAQIANYLQSELRPKGCMVVVKAKHLCMAMRGAKNDTAYTITSALRGVFLAQPEARNEFLRLLEVTK